MAPSTSNRDDRTNDGSHVLRYGQVASLISVRPVQCLKPVQQPLRSRTLLPSGDKNELAPSSNGSLEVGDGLEIRSFVGPQHLALPVLKTINPIVIGVLG